MIVPAAPTAVHAVAQDTPARALVVPLAPVLQVEPSVVYLTVPAAPAATHAVAEVQVIAFSAFVVPLVCSTHDWPELVVARIVPALPTAKHVVVLGQEMPFMVWVDPPPACWVQVAPSDVCSVMP